MGRRADFQAILEQVTQELGLGRAVYFQPPPSVQLKYPCIVYELSEIDVTHADNQKYLHKARYMVTVIDLDPDSVLRDAVFELPSTAFDRYYAADGLNHFVFLTFH